MFPCCVHRRQLIDIQLRSLQFLESKEPLVSHTLTYPSFPPVARNPFWLKSITVQPFSWADFRIAILTGMVSSVIMFEAK